MERAFDRELADRIRDFTHDLGEIVRPFMAREKELIEENRQLKAENARLTAKLQGVRDQVADVPDTVPTVDEIAAGVRGEQHERVNSDIRESMARMEGEIAAAAPIKESRGLSMLLSTLRNQAAVERNHLIVNPPKDDGGRDINLFPSEPRRVEA